MHRLGKTFSAIFVLAAMFALPEFQANAQTVTKVEPGTRYNALGEMRDVDVLPALRRDGRVSLSGAFFETDSAELSPTSAQALQKVASAMRALPDIRLAIVGHTDATGDFDYNVRLSQRRAQAVVDALKGEPLSVDPTKLVAMGAGPIQPIASNLSEEGRALNRRVTFILLSDMAIGAEAIEAE